MSNLRVPLGPDSQLPLPACPPGSTPALLTTSPPRRSVFTPSVQTPITVSPQAHNPLFPIICDLGQIHTQCVCIYIYVWSLGRCHCQYNIWRMLENGGPNLVTFCGRVFSDVLCDPVTSVLCSFLFLFVVVSYGFCFFRDLLKAILSILVGCRLWFAARLRRINRKDNEWMAD